MTTSTGESGAEADTPVVESATNDGAATNEESTDPDAEGHGSGAQLGAETSDAAEQDPGTASKEESDEQRTNDDGAPDQDATASTSVTTQVLTAITAGASEVGHTLSDIMHLNHEEGPDDEVKEQDEEEEGEKDNENDDMNDNEKEGNDISGGEGSAKLNDPPLQHVPGGDDDDDVDEGDHEENKDVMDGISTVAEGVEEKSVSRTTDAADQDSGASPPPGSTKEESAGPSIDTEEQQSDQLTSVVQEEKQIMQEKIAEVNQLVEEKEAKELVVEEKRAEETILVVEKAKTEKLAEEKEVQLKVAEELQSLAKTEEGKKRLAEGAAKLAEEKDAHQNLAEEKAAEESRLAEEREALEEKVAELEAAEEKKLAEAKESAERAVEAEFLANQLREKEELEEAARLKAEEEEAIAKEKQLEAEKILGATDERGISLTIDTGEQELATSPSLSFEQAFSGSKKSSSPSRKPRAVDASKAPMMTDDDKQLSWILETPDDEDKRPDYTRDASHSAVGAAKNMKVANRLTAYMDSATKSPGALLPPDRSVDSQKIRRSPKFPAPSSADGITVPPLAHKPQEVMKPTGDDIHTIRARFDGTSGDPISPTSIKKEEVVKPSEDIGSIRAKFDGSSKADGSLANVKKEEVVKPTGEDIKSIRARFDSTARRSSTNFVFGDAFHQEQRRSTLTSKQKEIEAVSVMRRFDQMLLNEGKSPTGEVDDSNIEKSFVFQSPGGTKGPEVNLHDGTCKVDYENTTYQGYIFLVHRTRGLLLLRCSTSDVAMPPSYRVPGGDILESEFLGAAKQTGVEKVQLQIAAREGAARKLYEETGIDVRSKVERLKPAVLRVSPPDGPDGKRLLKNENKNELFYFLQVSGDDFVHDDDEPDTLVPPEGEDDSPLRLKLSDEHSGFTFAKEPSDAAEFLKEKAESKSIALTMIMQQAAEAPSSAAEAAKQARREMDISDTHEDSMNEMVEASTAPPAARATVTKEYKPSLSAADHEKIQSGDYEPSASATDHKKIQAKESKPREDMRNVDSNTIRNSEPKRNVSNETVGQDGGVFCCCSFWS